MKILIKKKPTKKEVKKTKGIDDTADDINIPDKDENDFTIDLDVEEIHISKFDINDIFIEPEHHANAKHLIKKNKIIFINP